MGLFYNVPTGNPPMILSLVVVLFWQSHTGGFPSRRDIARGGGICSKYHTCTQHHPSTEDTLTRYKSTALGTVPTLLDKHASFTNCESVQQEEYLSFAASDFFNKPVCVG